MPPHNRAALLCCARRAGARALLLSAPAMGRPQQLVVGAKRPRQFMVQQHATHAKVGFRRTSACPGLVSDEAAAGAAAAKAEASPAAPDFDWDALLAEKLVWERDDPELVKDLRSDHAGETGAVQIYRGASAAMLYLGRDGRFSDGARAFVAAHQRTEEQHLSYFDQLLDPPKRSKLLPLWRAAGFSLGFLPTAIGGERALFATVEAVETFVEVHYLQHIIPLASRPPGSPQRHAELLKLLRHCCADEVHHRDDARQRWLAPGEERPLWARLWAAVVEKGSQAAVAVCRNV